jgi:hypothetical protein
MFLFVFLCATTEPFQTSLILLINLIFYNIRIFTVTTEYHIYSASFECSLVSLPTEGWLLCLTLLWFFHAFVTDIWIIPPNLPQNKFSVFLPVAIYNCLIFNFRVLSTTQWHHWVKNIQFLTTARCSDLVTESPKLMAGDMCVMAPFNAWSEQTPHLLHSWSV